MADRHDDYVITGSTYPGKNSRIGDLIEAEAKIIFVHGMISDDKGKDLLKLIELISSNDVITGIATHDPVYTIRYCIENSINVKAFLIPFNINGDFMGNAKELEDLIDNTVSYSFIAMKTLAAGIIQPEIAYQYISNHNICAVSIGMVTTHQAKESTKFALEFLNKK